jgi:hypothetical protein
VDLAERRLHRLPVADDRLLADRLGRLDVRLDPGPSRLQRRMNRQTDAGDVVGRRAPPIQYAAVSEIDW